MKFYKTLNQYKTSNLIYDVDTETAYSYKWYEIVKKIKGYMFLNTYRYSNTTQRHACKLSKLFDSLGIDYIEIEAPKGLQDLNAAIAHYETLINNLSEKINKPHSKASANAIRKQLINQAQDTIMCIKNLNEETNQ